MGGDKTHLFEGRLVTLAREAGMSLASVNYRLSGTDGYPAAMEDGARAIQFLRYKVPEYGLDPERFAGGGCSAGAGIIFWAGFRQDLADRSSTDAVKRQSTQLKCIASNEAQTSYDPNFIKEHISGEAYKHEALQKFFRVTPDQFGDPEAKRKFKASAALTYVSSQIPPVGLWYFRADLPMTPSLSANDGIHHPKFGFLLKEEMGKLGIPCMVRTKDDLPAGLDYPEVESRFLREQIDFVKQYI
jgi:hypothetical protein